MKNEKLKKTYDNYTHVTTWLPVSKKLFPPPSIVYYPLLKSRNANRIDSLAGVIVLVNIVFFITFVSSSNFHPNTGPMKLPTTS